MHGVNTELICESGLLHVSSTIVTFEEIIVTVESDKTCIIHE